MTSTNTFGFNTTGEEAAIALSSEIKNKNVLITGVSPNSLGSEVARAIAKAGANLIIIAGRNRSKLEKIRGDILSVVPDANIRILILDLNSLAAVRDSAKEVLSYTEPIHVLINNAGIMAPDYSLTVDGFESQFGVNHLGHFVFTARIFPKLHESGSPRIVNISSGAHRQGSVRFDDLGFSEGKTYDRWVAYGQSKTANILFSKELARRGVTAFSVHPGAIFTNLQQEGAREGLLKLGAIDENGNPVDTERFRWKTLAQGTATHIVAAFDPSIVADSGAYLEDGQVKNQRLAPYAADPENAKRLWEVSEQLVGEKFVIQGPQAGASL